MFPTKILTTGNNIILLIIVVLLWSVGSGWGSIHVYNGDPFREVGNANLVSAGSEGVVAARLVTADDDYSIPYGVHDGRAYIRFENITFWRSKASAKQHTNKERNTGLIQVVIFEAADRDNIGGSAYGGQRSICCTPDLARLEGCKKGEVIRIPSSTNIRWPLVLNVQFHGNHMSAHMGDKAVYVTKTGMYNLFFISCDPMLKGLTMSGTTVWKNPDGYLPGRMAPLMNFYIILSIAYALLCLIWLSQYVRFWDDILQLQHCITAVIGLGLFEMVLWYFEYAHFNSTGIRPVVLTTWVVTVGAVRKTLSRLLILCVSMGYGVVRPTLGGLTTKVLLLGVTYFLSSELLNITEYVGTINDVAGRARVFLVLPNAMLDAFLILWIFTSLSKTLEQLQAKRSSVKLDIYRKFSNALAVTVIASVAWTGYELYFKGTDPFNEKWQGAWMITAFWDVLGYVLMCVICYLWAPSQSSQRYAYSEEKGGDSDDDEAQALRGTPKGDISLVHQERKDSDNADVSDPEDELEEEGKRE